MTFSKSHITIITHMNDIEEKLKQMTLNEVSVNTKNLQFLSPNKKKTKPTIPIAQYDINGNIIRTYTSLEETSKCGYSPQSVSKCINHKLKLHDKNIFIRIKNLASVPRKIDPTPYLPNIKSTMGLNNRILNNIQNNTEEVIPTMNNIKTYTIDNKLNTRIGMFNKKQILLDVFTHQDQITKMFGHTSGVYDHLYGKIKGKNKIKNGYKNKFFFKKLNVGQTYTQGEKYEFSQFEQAVPRKFVKHTTPEVTKAVKRTPIKTKIKSKKIVDTTPKAEKNFFQRLVYLFTGK